MVNIFKAYTRLMVFSPDRTTVIISHSTVGSPLGLTRTRVLHAALDLIDQEGLPALTMRRLGQLLGVEGMALYHYVAGRDDLLDGVVAVMTFDAAAVKLPRNSYDWREYLHRVAIGVRAVAVAHPHAFPLLMAYPASADWWLRAPMLDSGWHHHFTRTLHRCGFDPTGCATAYRLFTSFLTGQLLLDSASLSAHPLPGTPRAALRRATDSDTDFQTSFAALLDQLSPHLNSAAPREPPAAVQGAAND